MAERVKWDRAAHRMEEGIVYPDGEVVLMGTWLYAGQVETYVVIQKMLVIYGSGDPYDPPDARDDQEVENYYLWLCPAGEPKKFTVGGGYALTLDGAKALAERLVGQSICWKKPGIGDLAGKLSVD